jgi:hypothetical protein
MHMLKSGIIPVILLAVAVTYVQCSDPPTTHFVKKCTAQKKIPANKPIIRIKQDGSVEH